MKVEIMKMERCPALLVEMKSKLKLHIHISFDEQLTKATALSTSIF